MTALAGGCLAAARFTPVAWRGAPAALIACAVTLGLAFDDAAPAHYLMILLAAASALVAQGALYRLGLGRRPGPLGLQWRWAESRLALVALLKAALIGVLGLLLFVLVITAAYGVASAGRGFVAGDPTTWGAGVDARGRMVVDGLALAGALGIGWVMLRVSLAAAQTVAQDRVGVLSAFGLTRGRTWTTLAALALVNAPPGAILVGLAVWRTGAAEGAAPQLAACLAQGLVIAGLLLPLNVGLMTNLYAQSGSPAPQ